MATIAKTEAGLNMVLLSEKEQATVWAKISTETNPVVTGQTLYTPYDKIPYKILSEVEVSRDKYRAEILVYGKRKKISYTLLNENEKMMKAVRELATL